MKPSSPADRSSINDFSRQKSVIGSRLKHALLLAAVTAPFLPTSGLIDRPSRTCEYVDLLYTMCNLIHNIIMHRIWGRSPRRLLPISGVP